MIAVEVAVVHTLLADSVLALLSVVSLVSDGLGPRPMMRALSPENSLPLPTCSRNAYMATASQVGCGRGANAKKAAT